MRIAGGGGAVTAVRCMRIARGGGAVTAAGIPGERRGDVEMDGLGEGEVSLEAVTEMSLTSFLLLLIRKESLCNVSMNATF